MIAAEASDKGVVFSIQRYCIDDGPGIRTTVFLKGCPLRCLWCSNPESQAPFPEVGHRSAVCIRCGSCVKACTNRAISMDDGGRVTVDKGLCVNCGRCVEVCSPGAMLFLGKEMTAEEVFREVEKDESYYRHSGGGVTVSGGEPLQQAGFVRTLLQRCRNEGFHTCIETCGCARPEQLLEVLPYVSLVLFDLKHMDDSAHRRLTGGSNQAIVQNFKLVADKGVPLIVRLPLIPGYNDSAQEIAAIACHLAESRKAVEVELMPYHNYGAHKYEMLFRPYELRNLERPAKSKLAETEEIFERFGIRCETRM